MGAFVAATTHAAITSILILFEMTGDYQIILPLMLACVASTLTAKLLKKESIYTMKLARRGVDIERAEELRVLDTLRVGDHVIRSIITIPQNMLLRDIYKLMIENGLDFVLVTKEDGEIVGEIYFRDIQQFLFEEGIENLFIASELVAEEVPFVFVDDTFRIAMDKLLNHEVESLPVIESQESRKAVGVISRREIMNVFNKELLREHSAGV
jgi:CIC family chloride channel protein